MKKIIFVIPIILFLSFQNISYSTTWYVSKRGNNTRNDGLSWSQSFITITRALDEATSGDAVWVAKGIYLENGTVEISPGISVFGGFAGTENEQSKRNIVENKTTINGGEVYCCVNNSGLLDGFSVANGRGYQGGGIKNYGIVNSCDVYNNYSHYGGGIYSRGGCVINCRVHENASESDGGGIFCNSSEIINCLVFDNYTNHNGAGVRIYSGEIINSTIYANRSNRCSDGICIYQGKVTNCISWNNGYMDIRGNLSGVSYSCFAGATSENHNIRTNPLFVKTTGDMYSWDFHLQDGSPLIDAGNPEVAPEMDIEGNIRPGDDGKVCIGAFESPEEYNPGTSFDPVRIYVCKNGNNSTGTSWQDAYTSITTALQHFGDDVYDVWVAEGLYQERHELIIGERFALYGGFAGNEENLNERDFEIHKSIIDGNHWGRCVRNYSIIDGFDVRNGYLHYYYHNEYLFGVTNGAGILNENHGVVANCTVYDNRCDFNGGGIYNYDGSVVNCVLRNNESSYHGGGGLFNQYGNVIDCEACKNRTSGDGGGIHAFSGSVNNCLVYENMSNGEGGGIFSAQSVLSGCLVYDNVSEFRGGGISSRNLVTSCTIYNNVSKGGGGIFNYYGDVTGCRIYDNECTYQGGGIYGSGGYLENCTIYNNRSGNDGGGIFSSYGRIEQCEIFNNTSKRRGGGAHLQSADINSCRIYENSSENGGGGLYGGKAVNCIITSNLTNGDGGGILNTGGEVLNCTIYGNDAKGVGGGIHNIGRRYGTIYTSRIINTISWNNRSGDISGDHTHVSFSCFGEAGSENNNIRANPLFMDTSGGSHSWNLHLKDESPCIDSGTLEDAPETDIDGNLRPGGDGSVCMGVYEAPSGYESGEPGPALKFYVSKNGNNSDGSSWEDAFTSITTAIKIAGDDLYELWVAEGIYCEGEEIIIPGRGLMYGGFAGWEEKISERDFYHHVTLIDGKGKHRCVKSYNLLDGVSVTNGLGDNGAGIYIAGGDVINCISHNNKAMDDGGGIYNLGNGNITSCIVYKNTSGNSGGGIYNAGGGRINHCEAYDNRTFYGGGGIYNEEGFIYECRVFNNVSDSEKDYHYYGDGGGGIYNYLGDVANSRVYGNYSDYRGGGIESIHGNIRGCRVFDNTSSRSGGGIYHIRSYYGTGTSIVNCSMYGNKASGYGGGLYSEASVTGCRIFDNISEQYGGGAYNLGIMKNCLIYNNAGQWGGGIYHKSDDMIINCTIAGNTSELAGKGIYNNSFTEGKIINCIVSFNNGEDIAGQMANISHSCFGEADGENHNISSDPLFVNMRGNASGWDLHLKNGSLCIDQGTVEGAPKIDIEENRRPGSDGKVCMGAYESPDEYEPILPGDVNNDGYVDDLDLNLLKDCLLGRNPLSPGAILRADANGDGELNVSDLITLILE